MYHANLCGHASVGPSGMEDNHVAMYRLNTTNTFSGGFPQDRAEYRGYCTRICGGDPFSVEDTLALQLERRGPQYADLAGDSVVGLASLAVTLASRSRLAVNGTVESVGRLLSHSLDEGGGAVGAGAGRAGKWRGSLDAVRNVVSSRSEEFCPLMCAVRSALLEPRGAWPTGCATAVGACRVIKAGSLRSPSSNGSLFPRTLRSEQAERHANLFIPRS